MTRDWWHATLNRYTPPRGLRPGAETCWLPGCGRPGREFRAGWLECRAHPEGPVQWYGGAAPLPLSNGVREMS